MRASVWGEGGCEKGVGDKGIWAYGGGFVGV